MEQAWLWLSAPVASPVRWLTLAAAVIGVAVAAHPWSWRRSRLLATWVHEAGHAVMALAAGREVRGIRLEADTSGVTRHAGAAHGWGRVLTAAAGYPAPAVAGALLLVALAAGHSRWALAGMLLVVVVLAPIQRSWRGLLVTALVAAAGWLLIGVSDVAAGAFLAVLAGYLLAASPRTIVELHRVRSAAGPDAAHSDADDLAGLTGIGALAWEAVFLLVSAGCVWWAVRAVLAG